MTTVRSGGGTYALFASELQGGYRIVTAYDLTALYTSRNAAVRRFLGWRLWCWRRLPWSQHCWPAR